MHCAHLIQLRGAPVWYFGMVECSVRAFRRDVFEA